MRFIYDMKKANIILGMVVVVLMTLCSCSNENIDQVPLLKKIFEISVDGSSNTTTLNYNGNKIANIDKVDKLSEFYYTDDLITRIVESDKTTQHKSILDYSYSDGKLVKITSSDNYTLNYIHKNDGSVSYEKITKDSNNIEVKIYHGILYFQNENLIKDERILDDAGIGILAKNSISLEYDYKNNALNNILGYGKLLNYSKTISSNNDVAITEISSVKNVTEDQVISSIKTFTNKYTYNLEGYPTVIVSENLLLGGKKSNHLKSVLFYD